MQSLSYNQVIIALITVCVILALALIVFLFFFGEL